MQSYVILLNTCSLISYAKTDGRLRRACSDASVIVPSTVTPNLNQTTKTDTDQEEKVECECCGMSEVCTPTYISRIKSSFCGKWVCGLCDEAVKEKMRRTPTLEMEEALEFHTALCKQFNQTVRLNPMLSLAGSMREIARKSSQRRLSSNGQRGLPKIGRTISCIPRIDRC